MPSIEVALEGNADVQVATVAPDQSAFVVQFRTQSTGASPSYAGRVEHVVSGEGTRFHSLDELLAFMIRVLLHVQQEADSQ